MNSGEEAIPVRVVILWDGSRHGVRAGATSWWLFFGLLHLGGSGVVGFDPTISRYNIRLLSPIYLRSVNRPVGERGVGLAICDGWGIHPADLTEGRRCGDGNLLRLWATVLHR